MKVSAMKDIKDDMSQVLEVVDAVGKHVPVLVSEVVYYLDVKPGGVYIDATFGAGGHTRAILEAEPTCSVLAIDWDNTSLEIFGDPLKDEFGERFDMVWGSFAHLYKLVKKKGITHVDGILADFGTSQVQIMHQPGFSIYRDTPLDMRMSRSHYQVTAQELINTGEPELLRQIFWQLGEERYARQIVAVIEEERKKNPITTTGQLAALVLRAVPKKGTQSIHPATRVFQALRMYVNKELENIESFLAGSVGVLSPHGRLVCISFHSLEDRTVKQFFQEQVDRQNLEILTKKVVTSSEEELMRNRSARSARLRAALRL